MYFDEIPTIPFEGPESQNSLAYRYYDANRVVRGKTMRDQLRCAVCYWHTFSSGSDVFGDGTYQHPWLKGDPMEAAARKVDAMFELCTKLGVPFFTFHDRDVSPERGTRRETEAALDRVVDLIAAAMERSGVRLLWGTANLFGHPRYMAGAATNPDPEVFAYAAAQVKKALEATQRLGGSNYVLWGGREGYETLLNTDMAREGQQLGRFLGMVAEHKHKLGWKGTLLIEPKPREPTKHQYDFDAGNVYAFLQRHGLAGEFKLNIEANHATLAGHTFQHEVAYAIANGMFGSIDINRGDTLLGWDTDQMPNDVMESALVIKEILAAGGFTTGGFNFDAKLRRQSIDAADLVHAHVGGIDTLARGLLVADRMLSEGKLDAAIAERYAGWDGELGRTILAGGQSLASLAAIVDERGLDPKPRSGRQEAFENLVSKYL
jgi:xylose isomerase